MRNITKTYPNGQTVACGQKPSPLRGKIVVITGKLESFTRAEAHRKLASLGAIPERTVTQKTDLVICGDKPGVKLFQAKTKGIPILTEQELLRILSL